LSLLQVCGIVILVYSWNSLTAKNCFVLVLLDWVWVCNCLFLHFLLLLMGLFPVWFLNLEKSFFITS